MGAGQLHPAGAMMAAAAATDRDCRRPCSSDFGVASLPQVANQPPDWYWWIWLPVIWLPWCKRPPNSASTEAKFVADRASITRGILRSGLGMRCWHASDKDHSFFIQVYAPSEAFLRNVAKEMKLSLELDRLELRRRDIIANAEASGKSITREELDVIVNEERDHELAIHRTKKYSGLLVGHNPYQYIYTPFNPEERIVKLFGIRDRCVIVCLDARASSRGIPSDAHACICLGWTYL